MGNIDITYKQNGAALATLTFESSQAWLGGVRLNALNNLGSNFLVVTETTGTIIPDSAEALLHYTDDNQKAGTMTLSASIPAPPGPTPDARFTVSGTVVETPGNFPVRNATVTFSGSSRPVVRLITALPAMAASLPLLRPSTAPGTDLARPFALSGNVRPIVLSCQ